MNTYWQQRLHQHDQYLTELYTTLHQQRIDQQEGARQTAPLIVASRLATTLEGARALLRGETLPQDLLDPDWLRYYQQRGLWQ